jgi:hypothetical protein
MDKNNNDTANFMFIISFAGLLVKLIFEHTKPADASIWGYGISAAAILVIMVIILANHTSAATLAALSNVKMAFSVISISIPAFITILLLIWLVMLNTSFSDIINAGQYSAKYNFVSIIETIFMILQILMIFLISKAVKPSDISNYKTALYITTIFNVVFIGIMNIILYYFTTDG